MKRLAALGRRWRQLALLLVAIFFLFGGALLLWLALLEIPSFDSLHERQVAESTKIYDRTGQIVLYDVYGSVKRRVVPLDQISDNLKKATLAIEDDQFYEHRGVRPLAILRALLADLVPGGPVQGGSTITQQAIKNTVLTQDRTFTRKLKELVLALKLEQVMTKDEILALYLNETPYGGSIYGVEEAARAFFGKSAREVGVAEAAYIAAVAKAPTYYSPFGQHREQLDNRKNLVIGRMREVGFLTPAEATAAQAETVKFAGVGDGSIKAPHFVMFVRDYLEQKYGADEVRTRGYKVVTTLDWELQQKAEALVREYGYRNEKQFGAGNAGLVAIDPKTGQLLAMVGSRDYFNVENEGNFNITLAHRQPGSSFKPFVYATAFNQGFTPETMVFDLETQFDTACARDASRCYQPRNYDGTFRGPLSLRSALGQSINIPAIKVLYLVGIKNALATARAMGITSLTDPNRYGLTLVLGGGEVSLLELTGAYGVFGNDGVRNPTTAILRVESARGEILEEWRAAPQEALPTESARQISDILSDDKARQPTFAANSALHVPYRQVAVKTGTTNDSRDAWVVGYTPSIAIGAWVGNNDNAPMEKKVAGFIVAPLWRAVMDYALPRYPSENFPPPTIEAPTDLPPVYRGFWQGGRGYLVDKISGKLATEDTPEELREERVITEVHSILYWLGRTGDAQFPLWEGPVRAWAAARGLVDQTEAVIPTATDDIHRPEYAPRFTVTAPTTGTIYRPDQTVNVAIDDYRGRFPLGRVEAFLNDQYLGAVERAPFTLAFNLGEVADLREVNELRVVVYDSVKNRASQKLELRAAVAE